MSANGREFVPWSISRLNHDRLCGANPDSSGSDIHGQPIKRFHARVAKNVHHFGGDEDVRAGAMGTMGMIGGAKLAKPFPG